MNKSNNYSLPKYVIVIFIWVAIMLAASAKGQELENLYWVKTDSSHQYVKIPDKSILFTGHATIISSGETVLAYRYDPGLGVFIRVKLNYLIKPEDHERKRRRDPIQLDQLREMDRKQL